MKNRIQTIPIILLTAFLASLVPMGVLAVPQPVEEIPSGSVEACRQWIRVLEQRDLRDRSWEFPFAAPRPAELGEQELSTVLELRRLARSGSAAALETALDAAARAYIDPPAQIQFWLAYGLHAVGRREAGLPRLTDLLSDPGTPTGLDDGQLVWVLTALADDEFLHGDRALALELYGLMTGSSVPHLRLWGNYQLAGAEFLARDFTAADRRYQLVCEQDTSESWRKHACEMAGIAGRLAGRGREGTEHGMAANDAR